VSREWLYKDIYEEDVPEQPNWRDHVLFWLPKRINGYLIKEDEDEID
jgi:hypothetical protein